MTQSQLSIEVAKLLQANPPPYREIRRTIKRLAAERGIGRSTAEKGIRVLKFGHPEIAAAVERGEISIGKARIILLNAPREEQPALLKNPLNPVPLLPNSKKVRPSNIVEAKFRPVKRKWTEAEIAKEKACLAEINAPSLFPLDAVLPRNNEHDAVEVREAIRWLREEEGKISGYKARDLDAMLLRTNRIQAYRVNYGNSSRPEGDLNFKIYEWASQLWNKQQRQHDRLNLRVMISKRHKAACRPLIPKAVRTFEKRFETFWVTVEDSLSLFKPPERRKLSSAFRAALINFFSEKSPNAEKMGGSATEAVQDVPNVGEFKAKG